MIERPRITNTEEYLVVLKALRAGSPKQSIGLNAGNTSFDREDADLAFYWESWTEEERAKFIARYVEQRLE